MATDNATAMLLRRRRMGNHPNLNQRAKEHMEHQARVTGVGSHKNKKKYTRKVKHKAKGE